jgi:uncharacterized protein involved in response to NO
MMTTELNLANLRPLFIAAALFALVAGASFIWGAFETQAAKTNHSEIRIVALPG